MRHIGIAMLALALSACGSGAADKAPAGRTIECAIGEGAQFAADCTVEDTMQGGRRLLIVRNRDGAFRRFQPVSDGRGVIPADGADDALARWVDKGMLEVTVGNDRYRFPAKMQPDAGATDHAAKP